MTRDLVWDGCLNVRDLGGLPTEDGGETVRGAVVRADNVRRLSDGGWEAASRHGIRTVLDLRSPAERADDPPRELDLEVVHLSLFGDLDAEYIQELAPRLAHLEPAPKHAALYLDALERFAGRFAEAFATVADAAPGGVLVHCLGGKDRTGLVAALLLRNAGVPAAEVVADYALSEERLAAPAPAPAAAMEEFLEELERRHGSIAGYLRGAGVTDEQLERARGRLRGAA